MRSTITGLIMCLALGICTAKEEPQDLAPQELNDNLALQGNVDYDGMGYNEMEYDEKDYGHGNDTNTTTTEFTTTTEPTTITTVQTITSSTSPPPKPPTTTSRPTTTTMPPPSGENRCAAFNTTTGSCKFNYNVTINSRSPCIFNCTYDPTKLSPLRLEVHLAYKHPTQHPTFVTVQQKFYMNSWTMPIIFPSHREYQKFTSVEGLLCPPLTERTETVEVRVTTASETDISMNVRLNNQSYDLKIGDSVVAKGTPVSPDYRLYQWTGEETSVLISAESKNNSDKVCAILALQNAKCPLVTDESGLRAGGGRFQTFTSRAGMVASRTQYPNGIHMIFWPLPDDDACTLALESASNHTVRHKSVKFQVFAHASIGSTWYIFVATGAIIIAFILGITLMSLKLIEKKLTSTASGQPLVEEDEQELLEDEDEITRSTRTGFAEGGVAVLTGVDNGLLSSSGSRYSRGPGLQSGVGQPAGIGLQGSLQSGSSGSNVSMTSAVGNQPSFSPPTTYAPHPTAMNFTSSFNPIYVFWWKRYALYESKTEEAQVAEMGFQHNLLIMAVFAALPTTELIRSYLKMLTYHGDEDQCFFNSQCLTRLWIFHDFARVFTNIGYITAGFAFTHIVFRHKLLTHRILKDFTEKNSVGVSRHYGLFISLGYGLIIQGLMSSLYHTCPNSVTISFDMMFMYVMSVAAIVSIWGLRHGAITHHVYPTMGLIGTVLLLAEGREWVSRLTFWLFMCFLYIILLATTTIMMSSCGIWSFSPWKILQVWKGWKPVHDKLSAILRDEDRTTTSLHILRILIGVIMNVALILYGVIVDPNVYTFILSVCLINMGLYFGNYILTKRLVHKERGTTLAWLCLVVSFIFWIMALVSFCYHNTDSEASASTSRAMNSPCILFGVFDAHDIWHMLSSFALYTFFVGLLTLDDDLSRTPSSQIYVF